MSLFSFMRSQEATSSRTASPQPAESTTPKDDPRNEQDGSRSLFGLADGPPQQQQHQAETGGQTDTEGERAAGEVEQDEAEKDENEDEDDMVNWPDLFFDPADEIWRCRACEWEVNHGECDGCDQKFVVTSEMEMADQELDIANDDPLDPESCDRDPPPHPDLPTPLPSSVPDLLSAVGVPPAMQERFKVEYSTTHGIIATADAPLRSRFEMHPTQVVEQAAADGSGPVEVVVKRPWKIHLGSRVRLALADEDGSEFMRDLVEAMYEQQSGVGDRTRTLGEVKVGEYVTVVEEREVVVEADDSDAGDGEAGGGGKKVVEVEWVTRRLEEGEELEEADEVLAELERDEEDGEDEAMSGIDDSPEGEVPGPLGSSDEELEEEEGSVGEDEAQDEASIGAQDVKEKESSSDLEVLSAGNQDEEDAVLVDDDDEGKSSQKSGSSEL
ncbi:hypothetical protein JCM8097_009168 [Rhodosporidiobolus ruineniae]